MRVVVGDTLGDLALVERVPGGADGSGPAPRARLHLGGDHDLDGLRELRLHEQVAGRGTLSVLQVHRGRSGEAANLVGGAAQLIGGEDGERKAVLRALEGGRHRLAEALRPPPLEGRAPRIGRRGHHGAKEAHGNLAAALLAEELRRRALGIGADAGDLEGLAGAAEVHEDGRHAREADHVRVHGPEGESRGHAGVDGIAAGLENARGGLGGQWMSRRDHPAAAHHLMHRSRYGGGAGVFL